MKRLRWILFVAFLLYVAWKIISGWLSGPDPKGPLNLANRPWFSAQLSDPRQPLRSLMLIERGHVGARTEGSAYQFTLSVARWQLDKDRLDLVLLQDEKRMRYTARTWACKGEAPEPFDLCLELRGDAGVERFYSGIDWDQLRKVLPLGAAAETEIVDALARVPR